MRIGVLTAGGDCPGLNAVIRAVTRSAIAEENEVVGIRRGYAGLAENDLMPLDVRAVGGLIHRGGTILSTSSFEPHREEAVDRIRATMAAESIDAVIAIGGEHTMEISRRLWQEDGIPVVGVPKTIDNDVSGTDYTFGFDTAVQVATDAIDRLKTTAQSHDRIMVVEVMGRTAGWIAVFAALAGGADGVLIPEQVTTVESIVEDIQERHRKRGKSFSIIVAAEGAKLAFESGEERLIQPVEATDDYGYPRLGGVGAALAGELEDRTGFESRVTVLGHVQRGGTPTATDRILATRYGVKAYEMCRDGEFGNMAAIHGTEITSVPLEGASKVKLVDLSLFDLARRFA